MKLNIEADIPLYMQLKESLKASIRDGTFSNNEKIPTEIELSEQYKVSRITVRRAVEELCHENYLVKRQGKGTFVKQSSVQRKMEHLLSFSDACQANGRIPSRHLVKKSLTELSPEDAKVMDLPTGSKAILIERINMADGIPIIYESNLFPYPKYKFLLDEDLETSLYQLLGEKYNIVVRYSTNSYLEMTRAFGDLSKNLKVPNGEPLFFLYSEIRDSQNKLVHISREFIRSEQYRFYLDDYTKL